MTKFSRRKFLETTGTGVVAVAALPGLDAAGGTAAAQTRGAETVPRTAIRLMVNGRERRLEVEDRWTLAEVLRDHLNLTGTKIGCDRGECGACTVLLGGAPIYSCSYLAVWAGSVPIETVEGLAAGGALHPLQQAFIDHDAPQCGFCTSGQLMSAKALLGTNPQPSADDVRAALTGNLCRCSNYNHYVEAVVAAATGMATRVPEPAKGGGL